MRLRPHITRAGFSIAAALTIAAALPLVAATPQAHTAPAPRIGVGAAQCVAAPSPLECGIAPVSGPKTKGSTASGVASRAPKGKGGATEGSESEEAGAPTPSGAPFRFFSPTSFWNTPLAAGAPLDPTSGAVVSQFLAEIAREDRAGRDPTINTSRWSVPIYTVPAGQPTVRVDHSNGGSSRALQTAWNAVPLPPEAHPAAGTDEHLVVWQPSSDRLWEFWRLHHDSSGWHAPWGGAMEDVSSSSGVYGPGSWPGATSHWGGSASSLSLAGGLISLEDLERGEIDHVLAMGIPNVRAGVYSLPAQRTDGPSHEPNSLPEGARLRLDPNLDLAALNLPPLTLMIAQAAQRYGIVIRSLGSHVVLYGQDPTPTGSDPYAGKKGYFEGKDPTQLLASFPWEHLQLLEMDLETEG